MSDRATTSLRNGIVRQFAALISAVGPLRPVKMTRPGRIDGVWFATTMRLTTDQWQREVRLRVLPNGQPKAIRQAAIDWCARYPTLGPEAPYLVLGVPYLSERSLAICREMNVGCIDLAGNCYMQFDTIYIEVSGKPNPTPESRDEASLFSPKSSRVARLLLSDVHKWWGVQEIADTAEISIGLASRIKTRLAEQGLAEEQKSGVRTTQPGQLLAAWLEHYSYRKNRGREFYTLDSPADAERAVIEHCEGEEIRSALALFSGAARVAPHVRMSKAFIMVDDEPEEIAAALGWKSVTSGANVMLLRAYDAGVFLFSQEVDGLPVVSDLQLYLDLKSYRGRGEEAAEFLFNQRIQPEWQREANTSRRK